MLDHINPHSHLHLVRTIKAGSRHANDMPDAPEGRKLARMWTVSNREKLDAWGPIHNVNAFLEDHVHDYRVDQEGKVHFYSRVVPTDTDVEVVFDYETRSEAEARRAVIAAKVQPRPVRLR